MAEFITEQEFAKVVSKLRKTFNTGKTKDLRWRLWQLKQLYWLLNDNEDAFIAALNKDLHRHAFESLMTDIEEAKGSILETLSHVREWAKGTAPPGAGFLFGTLGKAWVRKEPLGVTLIIGAWNYPIATLITVAVAAIAAGNAVILKPSEMAPNVARLLSELVPRYLDQEAVVVVEASPQEMAFVLENRFDFIFYTGSARVGRIIATAAAKHVTPIALELGGQAPAIVTKNADIDLAAKRLVSAKLYNLGQVCVCVNHVFVDPSVHDQLQSRLVYWAEKWTEDKSLDTLARIIDDRNFDRLKTLLNNTEGSLVFTGPHRRDERLIFPTIVTNIFPKTDPLLSSELFGPILPVIRADLPTALDEIRSRPHPLGLYIFSEDQAEIDFILDSTQSGGVTVNDVAVHNDVPGAPFGGVGESGYGAYHGRYGFDTFSHDRTVVRVPGWFDRFSGWRYPPFDMKNRGEVAAGKPGFKRGERMEDQSVGGFLSGWGGIWGMKWLLG